jgi:hypothetical protein
LWVRRRVKVRAGVLWVLTRALKGFFKNGGKFGVELREALGRVEIDGRWWG